MAVLAKTLWGTGPRAPRIQANPHGGARFAVSTLAVSAVKFPTYFVVLISLLHFIMPPPRRGGGIKR